MKSIRIDRRVVLVCLLLIGATAALYAPVRDYDFVRFDDPRYVSENPHIQDGVTFEMLRWSVTSAYKSNWHPLTWISHALDVSLFGIDPGPHHLVNVGLHIFNALLIFWLLHIMTGSIWRAGFVAGVFAIHPLHLESVVWISERKDVLSTFFGLLAIWSYIRFAKSNDDRFHSLSLVFLGFSLLAKAMFVTLPFLLLLLDYWPLRRLRWPFGSESDAVTTDVAVPLRKLLREKLDYFFLIIPVAWVTAMAQNLGGALRASDLVPLPLRLTNALVAYVTYLIKIVWPTDLSVHYPHPNIAIVGGVPLQSWQVVGSAVILALMTAIVVHQRKRRYLFVGWFWFVGMLVPMIGLVQVGTQSLADRYLYIPMVGLTIILAWGVGEFLGFLPRHRRLATKIAAAGAVAVLLSLWTASARHLPTWENSLTLLDQALSVSPTDTMMLNNLGNELVARGRIDEGIEAYLRGLAIAPNFRKLRENLDEALVKKRGPLRQSPNEANEANEANGVKAELDSSPES